MKHKYCFVLLMVLVMIPFASAQDGGNDFVGGDKISFNHFVDSIEIETTYKRSDDFSAGWRISGNKAVDIELEILANPAGYVVMVEHLHADVFIESTRERYDDITQDSMDDYLHGELPGFLVDTTHPYYETFSIEGSSPDFQRSIGYSWSTGHTSDSSKTYKFSEDFLTNSCGVYGNSLYFVYDVIYATTSDGPFYKGIVTDNIIIDVNGSVYDNTGNEMDEYYEEEPFTLPGYPFVSVLSLGTVIGIIFIIKRRS